MEEQKNLPAIASRSTLDPPMGARSALKAWIYDRARTATGQGALLDGLKAFFFTL